MKHPAFIIAVLALPIGLVEGARGDSIAYNLVDYAASGLQPASGNVDVSGQIITDGETGPFLSDFTSHITSASLTLTTPDGTYSVPSTQAISGSSFGTDFEATPSALCMLRGGSFSLFGLSSQRDLIDVTWFSGLAGSSPASPYITIDVFKGDSSSIFSTAISPRVSRRLEAINTWVFATVPSVPEPAVSLGLCTSLLGLWLVSRRRKAAA